MECIRLYDENGNHVLTMLPCVDDDNHYDLADPDGKVLWCGKCPYLFEAIGKVLPIEED